MDNATKSGARHSAGDMEHIGEARAHAQAIIERMDALGYGAAADVGGKRPEQERGGKQPMKAALTDAIKGLLDLSATKQLPFGYAVAFEAWDICEAANVLAGLASLAAGEATEGDAAAVGEPYGAPVGDLEGAAQIVAIMRGLVAFISSELDGMAAGTTGSNTKAAPNDPADYLIVGDKEKPSTWHLPVRRGGKPDHRLMGAAWAALHGGYRGNTYEGPGKEEAISKLRKLYDQEGMTVPGAAKADEVMVYAGDAVKALPNGHVGGYLVRFSSENDPDLAGEFFTKDTDFGIQDGAKTHVWFHHRGAFKTRDGRTLRLTDPIGEGTLKIDDTGVFVDAVLYNRAQYEKVLDELGWSSGTAAHLVDAVPRGKATWLKRWYLGLDATLTFGPCEPRNSAIPLKSLDAAEVPFFPPDTKSAAETETVPETGRSPVASGKSLPVLVMAYMAAIEHDVKTRLERFQPTRRQE